MNAPKYLTDATVNVSDKAKVDRRPGATEQFEQAKKRGSMWVELLLVVLGFLAGAVAIWTMGDPAIFRFFRL